MATWPTISGPSVSLSSHDSAAVDSVAVRKHQRDGLGINTVLFFEDARGERLRCVLIEHRHCGLFHDGAGIEPLIYKVHRATGDFDAVRNRLVLRVEPGKRRQKRRMNVQDSPVEFADEMTAQNAHV